MEDRVSLVCPDGSDIEGKVEISDEYLIVFTEMSSRVPSTIGAYFFGLIGALIGNSLAKKEKEELLRIPMNEVAGIEKKPCGSGIDGCYITMKTGKTYVALFHHSEESIADLERRVDYHRRRAINHTG